MLETSEKRNERLIKHFNKEVEVFVGFVSNKLKIDLKSEPFDNDGDSLWGIDFGDIYVVADESFANFEVSYGIYEPGGYWEPPSSDVCEYSNHKTLQNALFDVLKIYLQWDYKNFQESMWAEQCVAELEDEL